MEVTNENFKDVLPMVEEAIKNAEFLAFDTEFTGLTSHPSFQGHSLDTPEQRYDKLRQGSMQFLILQFGLAAFEVDKESKKITSRVFNFYTFPRRYKKNAPDTRFLCQTSSIDFLVAQGMDFNKVFKQGISYLSIHEESRLRDGIQLKYDSLEAANSFPHPDLKTPPVAKTPREHQEFIDNMCKQVESFQSTEEKSLDLSPCSAFQRKLIYQALAQKFPSAFDLKTVSDSMNASLRFIRLTKIANEEEKKSLGEKRRMEELAELDEAVGFTKVMKMISQSGKTVIGHNMMLDIMLSIHAFVTPLPEQYDQFKLMLQSVLPKVVDTKLFGSTQPLKEQIFSTVLGDLHTAVSKEPFKMPEMCSPPDFPKYEASSGKLHEAGYDALLTGESFAAMAQYLVTRTLVPYGGDEVFKLTKYDEYQRSLQTNTPKRKLPSADVNLPPKRRRSHGSPSLLGPRSIPTIFEEKEDEAEGTPQKKHKPPTVHDEEEDIGEPIAKKMKPSGDAPDPISAVDKNKNKDKMFEEPNW